MDRRRKRIKNPSRVFYNLGRGTDRVERRPGALSGFGAEGPKKKMLGREAAFT
jgi:hypothetical protein